MKRELDMDAIAKGIGAERRGKVTSSGGYFGAMQLAAEAANSFRVPPGGGRATNPDWTERRLLPLSNQTLKRLERIAASLHVSPLQAAALLLEQAVGRMEEERVARKSLSAPSSRVSAQVDRSVDEGRVAQEPISDTSDELVARESASEG